MDQTQTRQTEAQHLVQLSSGRCAYDRVGNPTSPGGVRNANGMIDAALVVIGEGERRAAAKE